MHFNKLILSLLVTIPAALAKKNGSCSYGKKGICINTGTCGSYGGTKSSGFCPNDPNNIKCCSNIPCTHEGMKGTCMFTSECGNGTSYSGHCPGGSDFKCCVKKTDTTKGVGSSCTYQGISGTCINTKNTNCGGTLVSGRCPGPDNVRCCLSGGNSNGGGNSTLEKAKKASDYARNHALAKSSGKCAKYVRQALQAAGFSFTRQPRGCDYHRKGTLKGLGFRELSGKPSTFNKGDIIVIDCENNTCALNNNRKCETNHIAIYDGSQWYSDFKQGSKYYTYTGLYNGGGRNRLLSRIHYYRA